MKITTKHMDALTLHLARVLDLDAIVDFGAWERNAQAAWERLRDARRALEDETRAGKGGS